MKKDKIKILTNSDKQTYDFAKKLAEKYKKNGVVIALIGDLGAGKTTFTQGFADGLGIKDKIISPTFILMRQHPVPQSKKTLYHIDLYRLEEKINLNELGLSDIFQSENIVLIEWADKILNHLPSHTLNITIEKKGDTKRIISIS